MDRAAELARATEAYQAQLEGARLRPDDIEMLEDLEKARAAMEVAWLEHHHVLGG